MKFTSLIVKIFNSLLLISGVVGAPSAVSHPNESDFPFTKQLFPGNLKLSDGTTEGRINMEISSGALKAEEKLLFPTVTTPTQSATNVGTPEEIMQVSLDANREGRTFQRRVPYHDNKRIYPKDVGLKSISAVATFLKPLTHAPQFFVNHPINFKQLLVNFHHAIGKRSADFEDRGTAETSFERKALEEIPKLLSSAVAALINHVFGDSSVSNSGFENAAGKSATQIRRPQFGPLFLSNKMGHYIRQIPRVVEYVVPRLLGFKPW